MKTDFALICTTIVFLGCSIGTPARTEVHVSSIRDVTESTRPCEQTESDIDALRGEPGREGQLAAAPAPTCTRWTSRTEGLPRYSANRYGATADDDSDDRLAIQTAVNAAHEAGGGVIELSAGLYWLRAEPDNAGYAIVMHSNTYLELADGAVLQLQPSALEGYSMVLFREIEHAGMRGGRLVGDRTTHIGNTGQWGMGVHIVGADDITVEDVDADEMWGDGFFLGTQFWDFQDTSRDISLCQVTAKLNRRQGLSIVDGTNIRVANSLFERSTSEILGSGIDVEPDNSTCARRGIECEQSNVRNLLIENVIVQDNAGAGLLVTAPKNGTEYPATIENVVLRDIRSLRNGSIGIHLAGPYDWGQPAGQDTVGPIALSNIRVEDSGNLGLLIAGVHDVSVENITVLRPWGASLFQYNVRNVHIASATIDSGFARPDSSRSCPLWSPTAGNQYPGCPVLYFGFGCSDSVWENMRVRGNSRYMLGVMASGTGRNNAIRNVRMTTPVDRLVRNEGTAVSIENVRP